MKRNIFFKVFTFLVVVSFLASVVVYFYVHHKKNNNGAIDTQPKASEFIQENGLNKYIIFSVWTSGGESNIIPGSDDYSTWNDFYASIVGLIIPVSWILLVFYVYYLYFIEKVYASNVLLVGIILYQCWFIYSTIKTWPLIISYVT